MERGLEPGYTDCFRVIERGQQLGFALEAGEAFRFLQTSPVFHETLGQGTVVSPLWLAV